MDVETRTLLDAAVAGKIKHTRDKRRIYKAALGEALIDLRQLGKKTMAVMSLANVVHARLQSNTAPKDETPPPASA